MKKIIKVKNNKVVIGRLNIDMDDFKLIVGLCGVILVATTTQRVIDNYRDKSEKARQQELVNEWLANNQETERTYSDIEYVVSFGDTLEGIVYSYQTDTNKVYEIMRKIEYANDLNSKNTIYQGQVLKLCDVPESHLADFGYTLDYSKTNPEYELVDLAEFIDEEISRVYVTDENESKLADFEARYSYARITYDQYMNDKDSLIFENILERYRNLAQEIADITGTNYNRSIKPHKIEEEYVKGISY